MTGNELLTEFDAISQNDFNTVLASTSSMKLIHLNTALRRVYEMFRKIGIASYTHPGGSASVALSSLSPKLIYVRAVRLDDSDVTRVDNYVDYGWHNMADGVLNFQTLNADDYVIEGYVIPSAIAATDTAISDIDDRLYPAIVKLAVVDALGAHEETAEQANRKAAMEQSAFAQVVKAADTSSRARFNSIFQ